MRINMQDALASLQGRHLATPTKAATRPTPPLPDSVSPSPEPPKPPEHESITWLRIVIEGDKATAEAVSGPDWIAIEAAYAEDFYNEEAAEHIRRHGVHDVIARCEAELKLLDLHGPNRYGYCLTCDPDSCGCVGSGDYPCAMVHALLSGFRHREGFKPEWVNA
ncbi:DUF6221 family protein [Nonomuraea sp. GTA35]|uniref:DUF6221 family protein n=1 Tax=Nonomuraea sp. GTA35 TaxID=1676746 RepID=UPI0035BED901